MKLTPTRFARIELDPIPRNDRPHRIPAEEDRRALEEKEGSSSASLSGVVSARGTAGAECTDESSRTRCKSIEFDPIDQAADSLPVITRGRKVDRSHKPFSLDRLSIPIFPRGIGYLPRSIFVGQVPSFFFSPCPGRVFLTRSDEPHPRRTRLNAWACPSFFLSLLFCLPLSPPYNHRLLFYTISNAGSSVV